jgi:hypothetical protein
MYENGKTRHVETIPGIEGGGIKKNDAGGEFNCGIRSFIHVTMYPQYNNYTIKKI